MSPELESSVLPPLENESGSGTLDTGGEPIYAPYGLKKDGTPAKKRGRQPGSSGGSGIRAASDTAFGKRISDELVELSAPLAMVSPMAMVHVERRADKTGAALVAISKRYPRVKAALESYFNSVAYKDIVLFVTGIPIAIMMDFGMIPHGSKIGIPWSMEDIWMECYGESGSENGAVNKVEARGLAAELL